MANPVNSVNSFFFPVAYQIYRERIIVNCSVGKCCHPLKFSRAVSSSCCLILLPFPWFLAGLIRGWLLNTHRNLQHCSAGAMSLPLKVHCNPPLTIPKGKTSGFPGWFTSIPCQTLVCKLTRMFCCHISYWGIPIFKRAQIPSGKKHTVSCPGFII